MVPAAHTTYFRSLIVFGLTRIPDGAQPGKAVPKYAPEDRAAQWMQAIQRAWASICMREMEMEHRLGKDASVLVRQQKRHTAKIAIWNRQGIIVFVSLLFEEACCSQARICSQHAQSLFFYPDSHKGRLWRRPLYLLTG